MTVRQRAHHREGVAFGGNDRAALEHPAQPFDVGRRPIREIAQRALTHLAVRTVALAQQDGGRRVPVRDGFDIHRYMGIDLVPKYKSQARDYMATFLDGLRQFFRDFRQFVVMASRKFRLTAGLLFSDTPCHMALAHSSLICRRGTDPAR